MDKVIHFTVTQEDINQGKPGNPRQCAIARAFKRTTGATAISVAGGGIKWTTPSGNRYFACLPDKAYYLMTAFDIGCAQPADIEIDTPTYYA